MQQLVSNIAASPNFANTPPKKDEMVDLGNFGQRVIQSTY